MREIYKNRAIVIAFAEYGILFEKLPMAVQDKIYERAIDKCNDEVVDYADYLRKASKGGST